MREEEASRGGPSTAHAFSSDHHSSSDEDHSETKEKVKDIVVSSEDDDFDLLAMKGTFTKDKEKTPASSLVTYEDVDTGDGLTLPEGPVRSADNAGCHGDHDELEDDVTYLAQLR